MEEVKTTLKSCTKRKEGSNYQFLNLRNLQESQTIVEKSWRFLNNSLNLSIQEKFKSVGVYELLWNSNIFFCWNWNVCFGSLFAFTMIRSHLRLEGLKRRRRGWAYFVIRERLLKKRATKKVEEWVAFRLNWIPFFKIFFFHLAFLKITYELNALFYVLVYIC
jgi:hypothetical protein